jgi:hypothetical protein
MRHLRRKETPCHACKAAHARQAAEYRQRNRSRARQVA